MTTGYIQFDFDILKYWASNGVEQLLVVPFECVEAREYGDNMPFRLKPKNSADKGHQYKLASKEVSEFAYNESKGLTFLVHESDLYITAAGEKKQSWLSSPWRHVQELPILNKLSNQLSSIRVSL